MQHVVVAHELGDELVARMTGQLGWRSDLLDDCIAHDDDAIGHRERLFLVVRHVDKRDAQFSLQPAQLDAHLHLQKTVEVAEWLVEQDRLRARDEDAGEGNALLLAAGELARLAMHHRTEADQLDRRRRLLLACRLVHTLHFETERNVLEHGLVREKRVVLEDGSDRTLRGRHAVKQLTVNRDRATRWIVVATDHA